VERLPGFAEFAYQFLVVARHMDSPCMVFESLSSTADPFLRRDRSGHRPCCSRTVRRSGPILPALRTCARAARWAAASRDVRALLPLTASGPPARAGAG